MTQPDHPGTRVFAGDMGSACQHRVGNQQMPGLRADFEHIFGECIEEFELIIIKPEGFIMHNVITAAVAITQFTGNLDAVHHHLVPGDQSGVDHKICILQTFTPICGSLQVKRCADFIRITLAKRMGCRQALWVYIHQANCTAG